MRNGVLLNRSTVSKMTGKYRSRNLLSSNVSGDHDDLHLRPIIESYSSVACRGFRRPADRSRHQSCVMRSRTVPRHEDATSSKLMFFANTTDDSTTRMNSTPHSRSYSFSSVAILKPFVSRGCPRQVKSSAPARISCPVRHGSPDCLVACTLYFMQPHPIIKSRPLSLSLSCIRGSVCHPTPILWLASPPKFSMGHHALSFPVGRHAELLMACGLGYIHTSIPSSSLIHVSFLPLLLY